MIRRPPRSTQSRSSAASDVYKRQEAEHHHPGDPEEQDVVAGDEHARRVEGAQVGGIVRPAERGERPQAGGEPGVEDVGVLRPPLRGRFVGSDAAHLSVRAIKDWDPVPPPELAGDAPVSYTHLTLPT